MNPQTNRPQDHIVEFLLAEYNATNEDIRRLRAEGLNRLNFYITITSSVLAGLVFLNQINQGPHLFLQFIAIVALVFLLLVGWNTFKFTIARDISTDRTLRAASRIRRFFIEEYPEIERFLTWETTDEPTYLLIRNKSTTRNTVQSILSLLSAIAVGIIMNLLTNSLQLSAIFGAITFVVILIVLITYTKAQFKVAKSVADKSTRFPRK